jgi:hypothetical protein
MKQSPRRYLLFFVTLALCSFTQLNAYSSCTQKTEYNILQLQDLVGWWGTCTKDALSSNRATTPNTFNVYFLQPTDPPKTVYYESALTKKTQIHLNPQNVMEIKNKDKKNAMQLLKKIEKYIPVQFTQVNSLDKANIVITLVYMPQYTMYGGIADNEDNINKATTKVYVLFNYPTDPKLYSNPKEFQFLFYHEIGHVLGLKETWDDSAEMNCQYQQIHSHMPCYGDKNDPENASKNPGPCTTLYTYVNGSPNCPYPVFYRTLDIAALQFIWGKPSQNSAS